MSHAVLKRTCRCHRGTSEVIKASVGRMILIAFYCARWRVYREVWHMCRGTWRQEPSHIVTLPAWLQMRILTTLVLVWLALAVTGCGAPGSASGAGQGAGSPQSSPSSTQEPHNLSGAKACPGGVGTATAAGTPSLILQGVAATSQARAGTVQTGELVQVRLPTTMRWTLSGSAATAGMLQPAGFADATLSVCVWNFRPLIPGIFTLTFAGAPICSPGAPCPQYELDVNFTVTVQ